VHAPNRRIAPAGSCPAVPSRTARALILSSLSVLPPGKSPRVGQTFYHDFLGKSNRQSVSSPALSSSIVQRALLNTHAPRISSCPTQCWIIAFCVFIFLRRCQNYQRHHPILLAPKMRDSVQIVLCIIIPDSRSEQTIMFRRRN
jgi:hypothetical protein